MGVLDFAAGGLAWIFVDWGNTVALTTSGAASGAVAGLATVTPASGFVGPIFGAIIGAIGGISCYYRIMAKNRLGYDDSLDVVGIHGLGGVIGLLSAGVFASKAVNPGEGDGLFFGNASQVGVQFIAILATIVYRFVVIHMLLKLVYVTLGLRVSEEDEARGLDLSQHSQVCCNF